jgi:hypothetical protein
VAAEVFTRQAVAMMHERAAGIPRTISVIADNSLLAGFAAGQRPVNADMVSEVCRDFDLAGPAKDRLLPVSPAPPPPDPRPEEMGLFGSLSSKRKRFSFFWN